MSTIVREPRHQSRKLHVKERVELSEHILPARTSSFLPSFIEKHLNIDPERCTEPKTVFTDGLMRIAAIKILSGEYKTVSFRDSDIRKEKQLALRSGLGTDEQKLFIKIARAIAKHGEDPVPAYNPDPVHAKAVSYASFFVRCASRRIEMQKEQRQRENRLSSTQWRSFTS